MHKQEAFYGVLLATYSNIKNLNKRYFAKTFKS